RTRCLQSGHSSVSSPHFIWCWNRLMYGIDNSHHSHTTSLFLQSSRRCAERAPLSTASEHCGHCTGVCASVMCSSFWLRGTTTPHLSHLQLIRAQRASWTGNAAIEILCMQLSHTL